MSKEIRKIPEVKWIAEGEKRFGKDRIKWRFVCPNCGNIQSPEDFRKYKDEGATPNDAYFNCIGRFIENCKGDLSNKKSPCNYSIGGMLTLSKTIMVDAEGKEHRIFDFAPEDNPKKCTMCNKEIPIGKERVIMYRPYCQKCGKIREKKGAPFASCV